MVLARLAELPRDEAAQQEAAAVLQRPVELQQVAERAAQPRAARR
jgi:hypothetical protein